MLLLAIDTSTPACLVALAAGPGGDQPGGDQPGGDRPAGHRPAGALLASSRTVDARRHGEILAPAIRSVLAEVGAAPADLGAIVVGLGPGPFTSLRVGIVTATALGDALGVPVAGLCSLDVLAASLAGSPPGVVGVATDARRREVYWAAYAGGERIAGPAVDRPDVAAARLADLGVGTVVGAGARLYADAFGAAFDPTGPDFPTAAALARLAVTTAPPGGAAGPPTPLSPYYLRRPDAAEPRQPKPVTA